MLISIHNSICKNCFLCYLFTFCVWPLNDLTKRKPFLFRKRFLKIRLSPWKQIQSTIIYNRIVLLLSQVSVRKGGHLILEDSIRPDRIADPSAAIIMFQVFTKSLFRCHIGIYNVYNS
jgi:hypothetical protein